MNLLVIGAILLTIGAAWRVMDVLVFNLGSVWINILPSKLGPLLILLGIFYVYRRGEVSTVLGLDRSHLQSHLAVGFLVFLAMYLIVDIGAAFLFAALLDPSYPLDFYVVSMNLLAYSFIFFFINAVFEETLFRGLLQNGFRNHISVNRAILLSSIIFGLWHVVWPIANGSTVAEAGGILFISAFLGIFFGIYYERFSSRRTLTGAIVTHTLVNFANENFKIGPDPIVQGPDFSFMAPGLMILSLILLRVTFSTLSILAWKFRVEDVESIKSRVWDQVSLMAGSINKRGLNRVQRNNSMNSQSGGNDNCS